MLVPETDEEKRLLFYVYTLVSDAVRAFCEMVAKYNEQNLDPTIMNKTEWAEKMKIKADYAVLTKDFDVAEKW